MSLRLKLLLFLGIATLVLPWAGMRYAREMESALRDGEQDALTAVAQSIASSLQGNTDLLYREPQQGASAASGPFDLMPVVLTNQPFLDGYADEWPQDKAAWKWFGRGKNRFGVLTGVYERMLYVLMDVRDDHWVFDAPGENPLDSSTPGDRVWLGIQAPDGVEHQIFLGATAPGSMIARHIETGELGQQTAVVEPRVTGAWQASPGGYHVEMRIPLSMIGDRFGVLLDDRDTRGGTPVSYGTLHSVDLHAIGRLITASPDLTNYLEQFLQPGLRLAVTSPTGRVLARADALAKMSDLGPSPNVLARLYRRFVDDSAAHRRTIETSATIYDREHHSSIGTLRVTQTGDKWITLRDRALTHMLNFTVVTSILTLVAIFLIGARLAVRLGRLRRASESALTREGLITTFPETSAPDELGDVARGFSTLLGRLNEYTGYLRTLAGKLAHEIRTPLTIVRSSHENLESEKGVPSGARIYLERARQGSDRLNAILIAMGAATRVEEAISNAERSRFDLVPLLASAADAYRIAFAERRFATELPQETVMIDGAPDLIVQMLDKLIDNAVDFSPSGATIILRLTLDPSVAVLEVDHPGPPIAPEAQGRLFESLWQSRREGGGENDNRPHFGLGLYIVRLIAEFHGGTAAAESLPGNVGARFTVRLARQ